MNPTIDQLLDESVLVFAPRTGKFDVDAVAAKIGSLGFAYRDERVPARFAVFSDEAARDACRDAMRADPAVTFPYVLRISVRPEVMSVWPESDQEDLRDLSARYLEWLTGAYDCRISNEFGTDMTDPAAYAGAEPDEEEDEPPEPEMPDEPEAPEEPPPP
jgi:hypothetical protein